MNDAEVLAQRKRIKSVTGMVTLDTGEVVSFALRTPELMRWVERGQGGSYCIAHNTLPESSAVAQEDVNVCIPLVHTLEEMLTAPDAQYMRMYRGD